MITQMKKTSRSYNQAKLKVICDKLCDQIDDLLSALNISDIKYNGKMLAGPCPIHDGDNPGAFNLYPNGDMYRGNWKCRTHGCEKSFKGSIIGFVRGVLSNRKYGWVKNGDQMVTFDDTVDFIEQFLGCSVKNIRVSKTEIEKNIFSSIIKNISNTTDSSSSKITRKQIRQSLVMPCSYFIDRGFSPEILNKYDVGICNKPDKEMYNRAVVPIYDIDHKYMVGCSGRSIFNKCESCGGFHDISNKCPDQSEIWKYCKWRHSKDFKSQNHLYNLWFAKQHILESTIVVLVESPGNVWRLEEAGIHNSVALFGAHLTDRQKILLDGSGAMTIITIMDNDDAGKKAAQTISDKCKNTYNVININIEKNDIAEMSVEEINNTIKNYL